jgi:hypothetical protein
MESIKKFNKEVSKDIIANYKACNIFDALTKYCPLPTTGKTENEQKYDSSMEQESLSSNFPTQSSISLSDFHSQNLMSLPENVSPFILKTEPQINLVKSKKSKRGCRGGINKSRDAKNRTSRNVPFKSSEPVSSKTIKKQIITVGDRLFKKVLFNSKNVPIDEGFQSQEQDEEYIRCKRTATEDLEFISFQESKKSRTNLEQVTSLPDSDDSNLAFPYSYSSNDGSKTFTTSKFKTVQQKVDDITVSTCRDVGLKKHLIDRKYLTTGSMSSAEIKSGTQSVHNIIANDTRKRKRKISNDDLSQLDQVSWSRYL